jgi:hypothetical protein
MRARLLQQPDNCKCDRPGDPEDCFYAADSAIRESTLSLAEIATALEHIKEFRWVDPPSTATTVALF